VRITFDEIKVKGTRRWTDEEGKKRQQTRTFMQTVNPFNKHANGRQKSRDEIVTEVRAERDAWLKETPSNGGER
jgi:hypothetical protein